MQYFSMKDFLYDNFDKNYRSLGFDCNNIEDYKIWKKKTIKKLSKISGIDKMKKMKDYPLNPEIVEKVDLGDLIREKVIINTQKNVKMPFYVLKPKTGCKKPVLAIHGHGSDGKNALAGIIEVKEKSKAANHSYAMDLAKMGFGVYIPDLCGSGERREKKEGTDSSKSSCNDLNFALVSLGLSLIGVITFDLIRLLDYIKEDSKNENVCCVGFSGGGLASLWLSAFDERVDLTVVSGYFHGFRDSIIENNFCGCNFVPKLWNKLDCGDFGALIAPRKFIVETGKEDNLNGKRKIENVYPQIKITENAFKLFEKEENFNYFICEGAHKWFGSAYDLIKKWGGISD